MKSLKESSKILSKIIPNRIPHAFLILSLVGFIDASYLTAKHYLGIPLVCTIFEDCEKVTSSQYATIGGIPVALLGVIYYLSILFLTAAYFETKKEAILNFTARLTVVGFLASIYFLYLQVFVIGAICLYCLISAAISTALFILGIFLLKSLNIRKILQIIPSGWSKF